MFPKIVFSDFDGTLTDGDLLSRTFFDVLDLIDKNNSKLIIVTGRPLSWGHFFMTHSTLPICITEGGGMLSKKNDSEGFEDICLVNDAIINSFKQFLDIFKKTFPNMSFSNDSKSRVTDRAIELSAINENGIKEKLLSFLKDHEINYSCSNVHLNFWKGNISKDRAVKFCLENFFPSIKQNDCIYFGDSLNDESMFKYFTHTVGVSNIKNVLDNLGYRPSQILEGNELAEIKGVFSVLSDLDQRNN